MVNISQIQGASQTSPLVNELVATNGIVIAVDSNGFYLQDSIADGNSATSDGIFVFTNSRPTVRVGDLVEVNGRVTEFTPSSRSNDLSVTQITNPSVSVISSGNALPAPVIIGSSGRIPPDRIFDNDNFTEFNPERDGIDFFESIEGMRVRIQDPIALSSINSFNEIYTLASRGVGATGVKNNPGDRFGIIISPDDFNPERIQVQLDSDVLPGFTPGSLTVDVQNQFSDITGVVGYSFGNYEVIATETPTLIPNTQSLPKETTNLVASANQLTIATYNVENLDPNDNDGDRDIGEGKFNAIANQIVNNLRSPDIIALQEIQDNSGSVNDGVVAANQTYQTLIDSITSAGGVTYQFVDLPPVDGQDGGQPGGNIRIGYLYNPNRVTLVPNSLTRLGEGNPDFNNSRKPLVAKFSFNGKEINLINNHFTSKGGSSPLFGKVQPIINAGLQQREGQARTVNEFVDSILANDPNANVVVLGDLNEFEFNSPLTILKGDNAPVLTNLIETLPQTQRYSYIFEGNSQTLDQILVSNNLSSRAEYDVVHVNSEYTDQASDHDPAITRLNIPSKFSLQLLHAADQEAGIPALDDAPRFSAVLNALKNQDANQDGNPDYPNTLLLSSGDAYIPGLFLQAAGDPSLAPLLGKEGRGRADIIIQNELGFQAIAFGNHEFDFGTELVRSVIAPDGLYPGANFPYLSSNLDFSTDTNLANLVTADGQEASTIPNKITGNTIVTVNGEKIGVVGATTPTLASISSSGNVTIAPPNPNDIPALAAEIQASVDALLAANPDINKVILLAHMQQIAIEQELATLLRNVDVVMAGGSNTLLADSSDRLRNGDTVEGPYPILKTGADGNPVAVINTDGNYKYVGRLVVDFDPNGVIIPESINPSVSGAYATDDLGVADVGGTPDPEIVAITNSLRQVIQNLDSNVFGLSKVFLNGTRGDVRTQETNLGNLTADANLAIARQYDPNVVISIKNGGGIRDNIGQIITPPGAVEPVKLPPAGNSLSGKPEGGISQSDIQNALRFNNGLTLLSVTAAELLGIVEHGVAATATGATPGQFPQVSGIEFSFDPDLPSGDRIQSLAIVNEFGEIIDTVVKNSELVGDPNRSFRLVTLGFLADGGDSYPFPTRDRLDLVQLDTAPRTGVATFAPDGSEQDTLAEYIVTNFPQNNAIDIVDTSPQQDERIQNLNFRQDTVLPTPVELVFGTPNNDRLEAGVTPPDFDGFNDIIFTGAGQDFVKTVENNRIYSGTNDDEIVVGKSDRAFGDDGNDIIDASIGGTSNRLYGGIGDDKITVGRGNSAFGGIGNDTIDASTGGGNNRLYGNAGNDTFLLGAGDRVVGGDGDDSFFVADGGNNTITGSEGADQFWIVYGTLPTLIEGVNLITDFTSNIDVIGIGGNLGITTNDVVLSADGTDTFISIGGVNLARVIGVNPNSLSVTQLAADAIAII